MMFLSVSRRLVIGLWLPASPALVLAQGREITGQVRYANGGAPADKVLVRLEGFGSGVIGQMLTDRTGKFRFSGLGAAQYVLTVHVPAFVEIRQHVDLQTVAREYYQFQLTPEKSERATPHEPVGVLDAKMPIEAQKEFENGRAQLLQRNLESGISHLEKAVSLHPAYFEARLLLATAYSDTRQWEKAELILHRALELNSKTATPLFALGEVYRRQERYADAEKALQQGLRLDGDSWQGHYTLGRVYWAQGNLAKAGPEAGRSLQLKPDFAEAHLLAGNILLRARQLENALTMFEQYLRLEPQGEFAGQAREAVEKIRKALAETKR